MKCMYLCCVAPYSRSSMNYIFSEQLLCTISSMGDACFKVSCGGSDKLGVCSVELRRENYPSVPQHRCS